MKIITASNGKKILKLSKVDWQRIGQKAGWGKSQEPEYLKIVPQHIRDQFIKEKGREPYYYELPKEIHDQQRELAEKEGSKIHQDHVRSRQNLMDFNAWMKIINVQGNMMYASKEFIDSVSDEQALILVNRILERSKNKSKTTFPYIQDFMIERIGADKFVELCANQLLEIPSKVAGLHKYDPTKKYWKQIVDKITIPNYINSWSDAISVHTDALYNITPEIINVIGMDNYIDLFIKASRRNSIVLSNIPDDVFNTLSANVIYKLWGQNISRKPRLITFIDDKVKEKIGFENYIKLWKLSLENDKFADVTRDNSVPEDVKPYVQEYFTVLESIKDKTPNGANRGNSGNGGNGGNRGTPLFSSNKKTIKMSKVEWQSIGKKAGWLDGLKKKANSNVLLTALEKIENWSKQAPKDPAWPNAPINREQYFNGLVRKSGSFVKGMNSIDDLKNFLSQLSDVCQISASEMPPGTAKPGNVYWEASVPQGFEAFENIAMLSELSDSELNQVKMKVGGHGIEFSLAGQPKPAKSIKLITDEKDGSLVTWYPGRFTPPIKNEELDMAVKNGMDLNNATISREGGAFKVADGKQTVNIQDATVKMTQ